MKRFASKRPFTPELKGMLWMLASCFWFSVMTILIRSVADSGLHPFVMVFYRTVFAFILLAPWVAYKGGGWPKTSKLPLHMCRAVTGVIGMATWFMALSLIPAAHAVALSFTVPLMTGVLAVLILRERMGIHRWTAIIIGFMGTLVILRPSGEVMQLGSLLALGTVFSWSLSNLFIKHMTRTDNPLTIVFYLTLLMMPLSLVLALFYWQVPNVNQLMMLVLMGVASNQAQISLASAYSEAEMTMLLPLDFSRLIFVSVMAYFAFGEMLDIWTVLGSGIILGSAAYVAHREALRKKKKQRSGEPIPL